MRQRAGRARERLSPGAEDPLVKLERFLENVEDGARQSFCAPAPKTPSPGPVNRTQPECHERLWADSWTSLRRLSVDVRLSTGVMSITAKLLHRVLFDSAIVSILEGAGTSEQAAAPQTPGRNAERTNASSSTV
jgi:hypothetical protein